MDRLESNYLLFLGNELATFLDHSDRNVKNKARSIRRILYQLVLRSELSPSFEKQALQSIKKQLPAIQASLSGVESGDMLVSDLVTSLEVSPEYSQVQVLLEKIAHNLPDSSENRALLYSLIEVSREFRQGVWSETLKFDHRKTSSSGGQIDEALSEDQKAALLEYLETIFPSDEPLEISEITTIHGGGSKKTLCVDLLVDKGSCFKIVLRMDNHRSVIGQTVSNEFEILETLFKAGVPVPRPITAEESGKVLGNPFIAVTHVLGDNVGDPITISYPSRSIGISLAGILAKMHSIPVASFHCTVPGSDVTSSARIIKEIDALEAAWRASGYASMALELSYQWLRSHVDYANGTRSLVHGDPGPHNMLGSKLEITALLDWETAVMGNPTQDLAYVKDLACQTMPWNDFLQEYVLQGGVKPELHELSFYRLFHRVLSMHYMLMVKSFFLSGRSRIMVTAYSSTYLFAYFEHALEETLWETITQQETS